MGKYISRKNRWSWSSGVLTFSETLDDKTKLEIIDEWRETFFCGFLASQYNDLWINHEDKNRTELHYIMPRLELSSGLAFNPYFVKRDFHKKDLFQEYINLKYNLTSFKDNRGITSRYDNKNWNNDIANLKKDIDKEVLSLITKGLINNRDEMIEYMREVGFEIAHLGKESISFTHEDVVNKNGETFNITMKGKQYGESYRNWESLEAEVIRESQTVGRGVPRDIDKIREELDAIIKKQAHTNRKQYDHKDRRDVEQNRDTSTHKNRGEAQQLRESNDEEIIHDGSTRARTLSTNKAKTRGDIGELRDNTDTRQNQRGKDSDKREKTQKEILWRKLRDDTIRTETTRRVRERERIKRYITKRANQRDEYANERASKRVHRHNTAIDRRAKRKSITEQKREARRERRYHLSFRKIEFRDEYHYQATSTELNRQKNRRVLTRIIYKLTRSIKPIIKRCKQGFNLRNEAVKQELNRGHQSILEALKQRANKEIENFKQKINLASFASFFGYKKDTLNTSLSMAVLRDDKEEIIIWREIEDNKYSFFNTIDESDRGTIIDFIRHRRDKSLKDIRQLCRDWIKTPQNDENISLIASTKEMQNLSYYWHKLDKTVSSYVSFKNLSSSNIKWLRSHDNVLFIKKEKAFYFKMHSSQNISGIMKVTEKEHSLIEGSQRDIFSIGDVEKAKKVVILEEPLSLLFYRELHHSQDTLYISTMGADKSRVEDGLLNLLKDKKETSIRLSFANNKAGEKESIEIYSILNHHNFYQVERTKPKDISWQNDLEKKNTVKHKPTSIRMRP